MSRALDLRRDRRGDRRHAASAAFEVTGVTFDSREVEPGDLFVAMPGTVDDGHKFVAKAFAAGRRRRARVASRSTGRTCWSPTRARR